MAAPKAKKTGELSTRFHTALFLSAIAFQSPLSATASVFTGELSSPASISPLLNKKIPVTLEFAIEYLHPDFPTIENIQVENTKTSSSMSGSGKGAVINDYPDTFAQTLKVQALLNESDRWTIGLKTYLPLNSMAQIDTGYIYQPEFVLYRTEAQRPRILLTSGLDLNPDWRVGVGADIGFAVKAHANVYLQSGAGTVSDQRISAKLKPVIVPQASLAYRDYQFTVRGENKAEFDLSTDAAARVFSSSAAGLDVNYTSQSAAFFQPWEFELSGKNALSDWINFKWSASYQLWSGYQARAALIQNDISNNCHANGGCSSSFSASAAPDFKARNLLVPEAGFEFLVGNNRYGVGYRFKDSIFKDVPTGNGNYLDPPRHDLLLSATFPLISGWEWGLNAQVSRLVPQKIVKTNPGEIGGPGYTASGWLYGGGASVTIPFKD